MKLQIKLRSQRNHTLREIALDATECEFNVWGKVAFPTVGASGSITIFGFGITFTFNIDLQCFKGGFVSLTAQCPAAALDLEVFVYQKDEDEDEANDCC